MNCYSCKKLITDDNIIYKSPDKPYKCCKYCREKKEKYYKENIDKIKPANQTYRDNNKDKIIQRWFQPC